MAAKGDALTYLSANLTSDIPSILKHASGVTLLNLLKSINGEKNLVIEQDLITVLDYITKVQQLKSCNVDKIYKLDPKEAPPQAFRCVYIVRSSIEIARIVANHLKIDKRASTHKEFYIIFVPRKLHVCDMILEREGVYGIATILEFPMGLLPIDSDMLSLELMDFYISFFLKHDQTHLHSAAMPLVQIQKICGEIPVICGQGRCAEKVIDMMKMIMREKEMKLNESNEISHLLIIDRDVDYIPILLTQFNYEGILDETYDIKGGRITFGKEDSGQEQDIKIVLNDDDAIFREIRNVHFSSVLGLIKDNLKKLQTKQDLKESMTIGDMKEIVAHKLKTAPQEKLLALYLKTCENIINQKSKWDFQEQVTIEQSLIAGSRLKECVCFIEEMINRRAPMNVSLRLMCILSIIQDGISPKDYKSLATQFLHSYGHKHIITFHKLKKLGLCIEQNSALKSIGLPVASGGASKLAGKVVAAVASLPKQSTFRTVAKKMALTPSTDATMDLKNPTDLSYVFSGAYIPMVCKLVEQVIQFDDISKLEDALKLLPGKTVQYTSQPKRRKSLPLENTKKTVLVYFLGGVTYAEVAALRLLGRLKSVKIVIATTSIINGNSLMDILVPSDL